MGQSRGGSSTKIQAAVDALGNPIRSMEKRSDCPLLTLGLVLDGSGFVRRSEAFDAKVVDGTTLAELAGFPRASVDRVLA